MNRKKRTLLIGLLLAVAAASVPGFIPLEEEARQSVVATSVSGVLGEPLYLSSTYPETPDPPAVVAQSAIVVDVDTGEILLRKHDHDIRSPASLTKLFTLDAIVAAMESGLLLPDAQMSVPPEAYAENMEPGSSLMFLGPDQHVSPADLMAGLIVSSGNDAAVAAAILLGGSVDDFMRSVNGRVAELGLVDTYLVEPSGLSAANRTTAYDLAAFARIISNEWPERYDDLFALRSFAYPKAENFPPGAVAAPPIVQFNRNLSLDRFDGTDGMKTGYIDESGYNLVVRAQREGRRIVAVVLGVEASSHIEGGELRARDGEALLSWAFDEFTRLTLSFPNPGPIPVFGAHDPVAVRLAAEPTVTLPVEAVKELTGTVQVPPGLFAPLEAGETVGTVSYALGDHTLVSVPVVTASSVEIDAGAQIWSARYRGHLEGILSLFGNNRS